MPEIEKLLAEYGLGPSDLDNIRQAAPLILENREKIADYHYDRLLSSRGTAKFFKDENVLARARGAFVEWLTSLVSGDYTTGYFMKLNRIGGVHVRIGLPAHEVNVQVAYVRGYLSDMICKKFSEHDARAAAINRSLNKLIDLNLDLMTQSYREEEMKVQFLSYKFDSMIIRLAKWFVNGFNMLLVMGLLITGVMVLGLCVNDFSHITSGDVERGVLGALGSLLMLWVVIELLDTQINHIKGSAFAIKVFVSVALVAELRKVLMASIGHATWQDQTILAASVLILGFVYWLISKVEPH